MKTLVIRLKENEHSCKVAKDCFDQAKKFGLDVEYVDAVNGNDAEQHYKATGIKKAKKFKKGQLGVLGCFFSHYYLWQKCIELDQPIIILEHDGYFLDYLPAGILDTFTDVLKLDNLDPFSNSYNQDIDESKNEPYKVAKYHNKKAKNTATQGFVGTGNYLRGAYSYIIKPDAARTLIRFINEYGHLPADQQIGDAIVDIRVVTPTLARLHPLYSVSNNIKELSLTKEIK